MIILYFITIISVTISAQSTLLWNIEKPYRYTGFIYTDSKVVVINPTIQIRIINNDEICNFYISKGDESNERSQPFRAVVKSASLGLAELELKPHYDLNEWANKDVTLSLTAEACHDPDSWSTPAFVSIKVLEPPGPVWSEPSYNVTIDNSVPAGTTVIKITAHVTKLPHSDNGICQYFILSPDNSPFQIDGEGTVRTVENLAFANVQNWTLVVAAKDCSQPVQRVSYVSLFVSVQQSCKFGWSGFHSSITYPPGSGVKYISDNPGFQLCNYRLGQGHRYRSLEATTENCITNKTLRLTTSVELKYKSFTSSADIRPLTDHNNCKFDVHSLRLQREICGIPSSNGLELLTELNRQPTGVLLFPAQANIFPVASLSIDNRFSIYFWMKRDQQIGSNEEYLICQIDEIGNNVFSVSIRKCFLRIQLKSFKDNNQAYREHQNVPTVWVFTVPQLCNSNWHHVTIMASRVSENLSNGELNVYIDGESLEFKSGNPEIVRSSSLEYLPTNMTDIFLGQCPKSEKTEFRGFISGMVLTPGTLLTSATPHCLIKCSERLYFNGMNRMNPGMSVSLNSEMQMIIINGHNIAEVLRLVKVIGFVNPTWDPTPGQRQITVETEMSCGNRIYNVSTVIIPVTVEKTKSTLGDSMSAPRINLVSTVTTIIVPDSTQTNSDTGNGVAVFANTTLEITDMSSGTGSHNREVLRTVSKCVVTIRPKFQLGEYLDWPRHLLEAVSAEKYSIKVTNSSRTVTFYGSHNEQVYQFVVQHLRYFSSQFEDNHLDRVSRTFRLQCFSRAGKSLIKSNVVVVKVTIWFNNNDKKYTMSSARPQFVGSTTNYLNLWKDLINNITNLRNDVPAYAQSNVAIMSEADSSPAKRNSILYNILLGLGLLTFVSVMIMLVGKHLGHPTNASCLVSYNVLKRICFPWHIIKEKIRPSPSVRVELSRDFIDCVSERRRDVSMEMQWDDTEMKNNSCLNIISNPMYETSVGDIDDICLNRDVPPECDEDDDITTDDDDAYGDFTDMYGASNCDKVKIK